MVLTQSTSFCFVIVLANACKLPAHVLSISLYCFVLLFLSGLNHRHNFGVRAGLAEESNRLPLFVTGVCNSVHHRYALSIRQRFQGIAKVYNEGSWFMGWNIFFFHPPASSAKSCACLARASFSTLRAWRRASPRPKS